MPGGMFFFFPFFLLPSSPAALLPAHTDAPARTRESRLRQEGGIVETTQIRPWGEGGWGVQQAGVALAVIWGLNGRAFWKGLAFVHSEREWESRRAWTGREGPGGGWGGVPHRRAPGRPAGFFLQKWNQRQRHRWGTAGGVGPWQPGGQPAAVGPEAEPRWWRRQELKPQPEGGRQRWEGQNKGKDGERPEAGRSG